jgi:TolB-like protein
MTNAAEPGLVIDLASEPGFSLGVVEVPPGASRLRGPAGEHRLEPRVMQVLVLMARHAGATVTRDQLIAACWDGRFVSDDAVNRAMSQLRGLTRTIHPAPFVLETIPKVGFRLLLGDADTAEAPSEFSPADLSGKPSLAVLPFVDLSGDPDQDYFVEGMMDEIVAALTRIRSIFTIASRSTLTFKGAGVSAGEAARRLGVRYVLEGSLRRSGSRLRIAVDLTDAREGGQIWAERFEDTVEDVFALQDRVALSVAGVIEPRLHAAEARRSARRPIESLSAYDLYLRAAALRATTRNSEVMEALALLEKAMALDPEFAPALAHAAGCHSQILLNGWDDRPDEHRRQALDLVARAVECGADDASVLAQAANAAMELDRDTNRAEALIDRATSLNPGLAFAWFISGLIRLMNGDNKTAADHLERAATLDPISHLSEVARAHIGVSFVMMEDYAKGARLIERASYRPPRVRLCLVAAYGHLGRFAEAATELALFGQSTSAPPEAMLAYMARDERSQEILSVGLVKAQAGARLRGDGQDDAASEDELST